MPGVIIERNIVVPEGEFDIDTEIDLNHGDRYDIEATGLVWGGVVGTQVNGPQGWNKIEMSDQFPLPSSRPFCLLGRLDGNYFYIGRGMEGEYINQGAPPSRLYLRINDDAPANGSGAFVANIQVWRP